MNGQELPFSYLPAEPLLVAPGAKKKSRRNADPASQKRRCVSTACVACRKRKSKCDGALPSCAACASVYYTECIYDPNSDHRRKGVYREKVDSMKAQNATLQILIEAILNAEEEDVPDIVRRIRTCNSLDDVAADIAKEDEAIQNGREDGNGTGNSGGAGYGSYAEKNGDSTSHTWSGQPAEGEIELARKMGELRLENGSVRYIGGTSHLIYLDPTGGEDRGSGGDLGADDRTPPQIFTEFEEPYQTAEEAINSWTQVTDDTQLIIHLMNMYFNWHYTYFTTLSKSMFYRDFLRGRPRELPYRTIYCTSLLVNAMLALGCHFTSRPGAFAEKGDSRTKGDHFFAEAKRLIVDNDEYEKPRLATVQALALMSVREAGCAREAKGWVYSGMSFRMAQDIGLNLDTGSSGMSSSAMLHGSGPGLGTGPSLVDDPHSRQMTDEEIDARRVTFWGCFLFDKAWSNYLGRLPQLPKNSYNVPRYDVFPDEDAEMWSPYTDTGFDVASQQPSRTRAAGLQLSKLCEISSDLLLFFYHPNHIGRSSGKAVELKKLSELHRRLEDWHKELPHEFEPRDGQLPNVLLTHMFFRLQYIHLFRPFLKYTPEASPLPAHVSPRRICTSNASAISKLMRLYKKTYNLRQICNIAVYMIHSACTIHLLNLPEKTAKRDIIHGVKQLEEIAEDWLCARRTLCIISVLARKWGVELPEEASLVLQRTDEKYGTFNTSDVPSPLRAPVTAPPPNQGHLHGQGHALGQLPNATAAISASASSGPAIATGASEALSPGFAKSIAASVISVPAPVAVQHNTQRHISPQHHSVVNRSNMYEQSAHIPPTFAHGLSTSNLAQGYLEPLGNVSSTPWGLESTPTTTGNTGSISRSMNVNSSMTDSALAVGGSGGIAAVAGWSMPPTMPNLVNAAPDFGQTHMVHGSHMTHMSMPAMHQTQLVQMPQAQVTQMSDSPLQPLRQSIYALDGNDYLLRESASWQHNFEAWNSSHQQAALHPQPYAQHQHLNPNQHQQQEQTRHQKEQNHMTQAAVTATATASPGSTTTGSTPMSDSNSLMYRGTQGLDFDIALDGHGDVGS